MAAKNQGSIERKTLPAGTLPWHSEGWAQFCASLTAKRLAHAVLLEGPRGTGKRHFADQAAALLLCEQPDRLDAGEIRACGRCKQCQLIAAGFHPDLSVLAPEDSKVIKIEQVRRLIDFVVRSPQVARRKVAVVDSADCLNLNAANALLKTLEEPADDVVLLLVRHAGEPLLPTIRSRCQAQRLALPSATQALSWLRDHAGAADERTLEAALGRARGAPLSALGLMEGGQLAAGDECLESLRKYLRGERSLVEATAPFTRLGLDPSLDLLTQWGVTAMKFALGDTGVAPGEGRDMLMFLARNNSAAGFTAMLDQITAARRQHVYNLNPELVINDILLSWKALMPRRRQATGAKVS